MKNIKFVRLTALVLTISTLLVTFAGCGMFYKDTTPKEDPIPYLDNYLINTLEPTSKNCYDRYTYTNAASKTIYMGGHAYHGGFTIYDDGGEGEGFATFDISEYNDKILSFLMGSNQQNGFQESGVWLVSVTLDGEKVIEARIQADSLPEHYTLDLTGKKELKFSIVRCENAEARLAVAEMTVWDSAEEVVSGLYVADPSTQAQLIKDIFPYLYVPASSEEMQVYTEKELPAYVSDFDASSLVPGSSVSVGGKTYTDAFTQRCWMPTLGTMKRGVYFNVEGLYEYLTFSVGGKDGEANENLKSGSSWLTIYADGEMVHEELVQSDSLPKRYTVAIKGCKVLKFEFQFEDGGDHTVAVFDAYLGKTESNLPSSGETSAADLPDVCKLVSNIAPYTVASNLPKSVFDGSSKYETFSMAGRKYNEGVVLYANVGFLTGNSGAHACFNLEGEFKYLTFKAGLVDNSPTIIDDTLNIYLNGKLTQSITLYATDLPTEYQIELNNCQELKLELVGRENYNRPAYGFSEMVLYRNEVTEHNLFPEETVDYPDSMPLIENIAPYQTYVSYDDSYGWKTVYDGSTKKEYFEIGEEKIYSGLILCTSVHLDLAGEGGGFSSEAIYIAMVGLPIFNCPVALLAAGVLHENAFAAFDLQGEFTKLSFTVACKENLVGYEENTTLKIGIDGKIAENLTLSPDMEPTTFTVNIENTEQLMFFLECGESSSSYYAIYDIVVEK